ncbi:MAG: YkvA family protein [Candidatus Dormibacteria bacterium]
MLNRVRFLKRFAVDLPRKARLAYCLMRDPRVPRHTKVAFGAGMGVIVTPFVDLPAAIPLVGELDMLALSLLAMRLFIAACPDDVVIDVQQQILEGRSVFDDDVHNGERLAGAIARRFQHDEVAPPQPAGFSEPAPSRTAEPVIGGLA